MIPIKDVLKILLELLGVLGSIVENMEKCLKSNSLSSAFTGELYRSIIENIDELNKLKYNCTSFNII